MPKKTLALIIGLIVLTIVLLLIALRLEKAPEPEKQTTQEKISSTPQAPVNTTIMIDPNQINVTGNTGSADIVINTQDSKGSNDVTGIQLEIGYDPEVLNNVTLEKGDFFKDAIVAVNNVDEQTGRITYALILTPSQKSISGQGIVAKLNFARITGSINTTNIELMPKTAVSSPGYNQSVLKEAKGAQVVFQN